MWKGKRQAERCGSGSGGGRAASRQTSSDCLPAPYKKHPPCAPQDLSPPDHGLAPTLYRLTPYRLLTVLCVQLPQRVVLLVLPAVALDGGVQVAPPAPHALLVCSSQQPAAGGGGDVRDAGFSDQGKQGQPDRCRRECRGPTPWHPPSPAAGPLQRNTRPPHAPVRPGRRRAISAQLLPCFWTSCARRASSSGVHFSREMLGLTRWRQRCAHCCPVLPAAGRQVAAGLAGADASAAERWRQAAG